MSYRFSQRTGWDVRESGFAAAIREACAAGRRCRPGRGGPSHEYAEFQQPRHGAAIAASPSDCSHCDIEIEGSPLKIRITPASLTVQTQRPASPKRLVETFFEAQKQLSATPVMKAITAGSK